MTDQEFAQFALEMGSLCVAFRVEPSKPLFKIYHQHLRAFSLDAVTYAINHLIDTGDRFPVVARIREMANAYRPPIAHRIPQAENLIEEFTSDVVKGPPEDVDEFFKSLADGPEKAVSASKEKLHRQFQAIQGGRAA